MTGTIELIGHYYNKPDETTLNVITLLSLSLPSPVGSMPFRELYPWFILCMRRLSLLFAISLLNLRSFSICCLGPL